MAILNVIIGKRSNLTNEISKISKENLIFSNKDLKLFEIIPSDHLSLKCKRFSNILGFEYNRFNLKRIDQVGGDMLLDKKTLTKILSSV